MAYTHKRTENPNKGKNICIYISYEHGYENPFFAESPVEEEGNFGDDDAVASRDPSRLSHELPGVHQPKGWHCGRVSWGHGARAGHEHEGMRFFVENFLFFTCIIFLFLFFHGVMKTTCFFLRKF